MSRSRLFILPLFSVYLLLLSGCATSPSDPQGSVAPRITAQPVNASVTVGQPATFSVVAAGNSPLTYQWQKNSTNIGGATGSTYTTPATPSADHGSKFNHVANNPTAHLHNNTPPPP